MRVGSSLGADAAGLRKQHVVSIQWLAQATDAEVEGLHIGSKTLTFCPRCGPHESRRRGFKLAIDSGTGSATLVLQAILPFLIFAGNEADESITVELTGGTNASFSPSFEYLDQVVFPVLRESFGIRIEGELKQRGWSLGPQTPGVMTVTVHPLKPGETIKFRPLRVLPSEQSKLVASRIDMTILAPWESHKTLQKTLRKELKRWFPQAETNLKLVEDSKRDACWYVLLVAHSSSGEVRWAVDILTSLSKKVKATLKSPDVFCARLSDSLARGLRDEVETGGAVDVHLQDQLVYIQALCEGFSSMPRDPGEGPRKGERGRTPEELGLEELRIEDPTNGQDGPFGHGSDHARTARWVCRRLLPQCRFLQHGDVVDGVGFSVSSASMDDTVEESRDSS